MGDGSSGCAEVGQLLRVVLRSPCGDVDVDGRDTDDCHVFVDFESSSCLSWCTLRCVLPVLRVCPCPLPLQTPVPLRPSAKSTTWRQRFFKRCVKAFRASS